MKTCRIPYENKCRSGVRNLCIVPCYISADLSIQIVRHCQIMFIWICYGFEYNNQRVLIARLHKKTGYVAL